MRKDVPHIIQMEDDYGHYFFETNATDEEIQEAINAMVNLETDRLVSDEEFIQEHLEKKGRYFSKTEIKTFTW